MDYIFSDIKNIFSKYSGDIYRPNGEKFVIDYSLLNSIVHPSTEQMPTAAYPVNVTVDIKNDSTKEHVIMDIPLLNVPLYTNMGVKINSTYYGICSENSMAPGWYHLSKDGMEFVTQLHVISGRQISFVSKRGVISAKIGAKGEELPLGIYLKAISGLTYDELQTKIGLRNSLISKSFIDEVDYDTCIDIVLQKLLPSNDSRRFSYSDVPADVKVAQVKERLGSKFITLGDSVKDRYESTTSFTARCKGLTLEKPIKQMPELAVGTLLTVDILEKIDAIEDLTTIFVKKNGRTFEIKRYRISDDEFLSLNEIATQLNILVNNMCGFDYITGKFDTINREVVPFKDQVLRIIDERMSDLHINLSTTLSSNSISLINLSEERLGGYDMDSYINAIKSQLAYAQLSETNNIWAQKNKEYKTVINFNGPATSIMVSIKDFQYGLIDLYQIPESTKIGSVDYMAVSTITENNVMKSPHYKVVNGVIDKSKIVYLSADDFVDKYIAFFDTDLTKPHCMVFYNNGTDYIEPKDVDYIQCSVFNTVSIAHAAIPFAQFIDGKRIVMGCSQFKQAQDCLASEAPLVSTGALSFLSDISEGVNRAKDIAESIYNLNQDSLVGVNIEEFKKLPVKLVGTSDSMQNYRGYVFELEFEGEKFTSTVTQPFGHKSSDNGMVHFFVAKSKTFIYQGDDIVLYRNSIIETNPSEVIKHVNIGELEGVNPLFDFDSAVGVNLLVAYTSGGIENMDDSIKISGALRGTGKLANLRLYEYRQKKVNKPGVVETFAYNKETDTHGIDGMPKNDIYIPPKGVVFYKKRTETKNGVAETNYIPCTLEADREGFVLTAYESGDEAICCIAHIAEIEEGDKLAGDHGNKGVVGKIVPRKDMPFLEDGTPIEVLLNPLGVPSRMNFAQFIVALLGRKMQLDGTRMIVSPYNPESYDIVKSALLDDRLKPVRLYDGRTCRPMDRDTFVGVIYLKKQVHNVKSKFNAVGKPNKYNMMTNAPNKGKSIGGGQSIGEMETWALMSNGATHLLYEFMSVKSGDNRALGNLMSSISKGEKDTELLSLRPDINNTDDLNMIYTMLGTKIFVDSHLDEGRGVSYNYRPLTDRDIVSLAERAINPSKDSLQSDHLFGMVNTRPAIAKTRTIWQYMDLGHEIVHPIHLYKSDFLTTIYVRLNKVERDKRTGEMTIDSQVTSLGREMARNIVKGMMYVGVQKAEKDSLVTISKDRDGIDPRKFDVITGIPGLVYLLKSSTLAKSKSILTNSLERIRNNGKMKGKIKDARLFKINSALSVIQHLESVGFDYRDLVITKFPIIPRAYRVSIDSRSANFDYYYGKIRSAVELNSSDAPNEIYKEVLRFIGLDESEKLPASTQAKNFLEFLVGKNSRNNHGYGREQLASKVIGFSGRSSIIPGDIPLGYVGVPRSMCYTLFETEIKNAIKQAYPLFESETVRDNPHLVNFFNAMQSKSRTRAVEAIKELYGNNSISIDECMEMVHNTDLMMREILSDSAVVFGRQPTLRPESIRGSIPIMTEGFAISIHISTCLAFNADFDGDQMWIAVAHSKEGKRDALTKLHPSRGVYSPKDGSVNFKPSQDVLLGLYLATMLHGNVMDYREIPEKYSAEKVSYFTDLELMEYYVKTGEINIKDFVCYTHSNGKKYISTAGRVLFNSYMYDGFTEEPFTNPLNIEFINPENYCNLRYDGLIKDSKSSLKSLRKGFKDSNYYPIVPNADPKDDSHWKEYKVYSIKDIFIENARLFDVDSVCGEFIDKVIKFGIDTIVVSGITLSFLDFKEDNLSQLFAEKYYELFRLWRNMYNGGLMSEEGLNELLIQAGQYCAKIVQKQLMSQYDRNDNVYVVVDSGARGSVGQIMKSTGMIGIVSKSNTEQIPSPIFNGFRYGLTQAELFVLSYGTRLGVSTTQLDTAKVGAMTRDLVFTTSLFTNSTDCGVGYTDIPVEYDEPFASNPNILANRIDYNSELGHMISRISPSREITSNVIDFIHKNKITDIPLSNGETIIFKYKLSPLFSNMMLNKLIRDPNVSGTVGTTNPTVFITKAMLEEIEEKQLKSIKARTVISCKSVKGVCSHCYGVRHEDHKLPPRDYAVGSIAATSIGEPSTQLVLNMINQGGSANSSAGALDICNALISGSQKSERFPSAHLATSTNFIRVIDEGHNVLIKRVGEVEDIRVAKSDCLVVDGEFVKVGMPLTKGIIYVTDLPTEGDNWIFKREYQQVKSLYALYHGSNLSVDARHFEVIVKSQLDFIEVCDSKDPNIIPGRIYSYEEVKDSIDKGLVRFRHRPLSKTERVFQLAGTASTILYADAAKSVAMTAVNPAYNIRTDSPLEQIMTGANMITNTTKEVNLKVYDKDDSDDLEERLARDFVNNSTVEIIVPDSDDEEMVPDDSSVDSLNDIFGGSLDSTNFFGGYEPSEQSLDSLFNVSADNGFDSFFYSDVAVEDDHVEDTEVAIPSLETTSYFDNDVDELEDDEIEDLVDSMVFDELEDEDELEDDLDDDFLNNELEESDEDDLDDFYVLEEDIE